MDAKCENITTLTEQIQKDHWIQLRCFIQHKPSAMENQLSDTLYY